MSAQPHDSARIRRNSLWMMAEQVIRLSIAMLLTAWIARSLGPAEMGRLSFGLSLVALFGVVTSVGLSRILVREFSGNSDPAAEQRLIATAAAMRMVASGAMCVVAIAVAMIVSPRNTWIVAILVPGFFFNSLDLVNLLYQSRLQSERITQVKLMAFSISSAIKMAILAAGGGLAWIAVACLVDWVVAGLALAGLYWRDHRNLMALRPDAMLAKRLIGESWVEIIAGFGGLVFMRIDQVMLEVMRDSTQVALMAVSSRLTEAWYFVPASIVSSTFPVIVRLMIDSPEAARRQLRALYRLLIALTVTAAAATTLLADQIIHLLYGPKYAGAAGILVIQVWCGVFMALGIASGSWLVANRMIRINLHRNLLGAGVNVLLNLALIPRYGATGAAFSTLAAFACAYFLSDFIDPRTRQIGMEKLRSFAFR